MNNKSTMQKFVILSVIGILSLFTSAAQQKTAKETINWMTLEQVEAKMKEEPRPILIDLYTDWCGWCKVMDKKTYSNTQVIRYLNDKFYNVKLNAESRSEFSFKGKKYSYNPEYKTNDIAIFLTGGQLSYPTTVIIPDNNSYPQPIAGFLEVDKMELITTYFGENLFGKQSFESYARRFKPHWK
jgi:thioredoxin-related protein